MSSIVIILIIIAFIVLAVNLMNAVVIIFG